MNKAFTLIEVVVTLAILAIVTAIAVPRIVSAHVSTRLDAAENRIVSMFDAAADHARARSGYVTLQISAAKDTVTIYSGRGSNLGAVIEQTEFADPPYTVDINTTNIADPGGNIVVDGDGIYESAAKIRMTADGVQRVVTLSGPVGTIAPESTPAKDETPVIDISILGIGIKVGG